MSSLARSKMLAVCAVGGSMATLGYMYVAGTQSKAEQGPASLYKTTEQGAGLTSGQSDARMSSQDVRAAVRGDKKT